MIENISSGDKIPEQSAVIEVRMRDLAQLFDSLDPSPFHEKTLDADAEEYILEDAKELPRTASLALVVYVDQPIGLPDEGRLLGDAVRTHFARRAEQARRRLRDLIRRGWISLAIGLSFLAASLFGGELAERMSPGPLGVVVHQSLLIGGWVAMWRPLEIFLYDWWEVLGEQRWYERLSQMPVRVVYTGVHAAGERPQVSVAH